MTKENQKQAERLTKFTEKHFDTFNTIKSVLGVLAVILPIASIVTAIFMKGHYLFLGAFAISSALSCLFMQGVAEALIFIAYSIHEGNQHEK